MRQAASTIALALLVLESSALQAEDWPMMAMT